MSPIVLSDFEKLAALLERLFTEGLQVQAQNKLFASYIMINFTRFVVNNPESAPFILYDITHPKLWSWSLGQVHRFQPQWNVSELLDFLLDFERSQNP